MKENEIPDDLECVLIIPRSLSDVCLESIVQNCLEHIYIMVNSNLHLGADIGLEVSMSLMASLLRSVVLQYKCVELEDTIINRIDVSLELVKNKVTKYLEYTKDAEND